MPVLLAAGSGRSFLLFDIDGGLRLGNNDYLRRIGIRRRIPHRPPDWAADMDTNVATPAMRPSATRTAKEQTQQDDNEFSRFHDSHRSTNISLIR
jgi:hypothetical protein